MASTTSLLEHLEVWRAFCMKDPLACASDMLSDILRLPGCFSHPQDWCVIAGGVCVVSLLFFIMWLTVSCYFLRCLYRRCRRRVRWRPLPDVPGSKIASKLLKKEKKEMEKEKKAMVAQEKIKQRTAASAAEDLLDIYSKSGIQYQKDKPLPDIGSRLEKYWYRVTSQENYECHILTIGYLSESFTCSLEVEGYMNQQLAQLQHPYLQTINDIKFLQQEGKRQVAIVQPFWEKGSLKDLIYKADPLADWAKKYNKVADPLPAEKVALFGGQMLQAILYLYSRGYNPLGHIQTGNVYMQGEDTCRLGGYENTLLKNRARLYRTCANFKCLEAIDTIMFGHVLYEMSAGKELAHLVPNEEEYSFVLDDSCKEVLQFIFTRNSDGTFIRAPKHIQGHRFFSGPHQPIIEPTSPITKQSSVSPPVTSRASKLGFLAKSKNKKQQKS